MLYHSCVWRILGSCFIVCVVGTLPEFGAVQGADWHQWRGEQRDGVDHSSPALIAKLPDEGLKPVWVATDIPSGRDGGWASPVIVDQKVYQFVHHRQKLGDKLPKAKYSYLPPDKRNMSDAEFEEYERKRRDEQQTRSGAYRFDEKILCYDAKSGKLLWTYTEPSVYSRFPQSGSPTVVGDKIVYLGAGRLVRCVDGKTGKLAWERRLPGDFRDEFLQASVLVADETVVVLCGQLFALDLESGKIRWGDPESDFRGDHASPVVWRHESKSYIVANGRGETVCLNLLDGTQQWSVKSGASKSTPIVIGDQLYTYGSSRKNGLRRYRLTPASAELMWTFQGAADSGASPVVKDGAVYVQGERRLACVDVETGKAKWSTMLDLDRPRYTSLIAADQLVVYAFDGVLAFAATTSGYKELVNAKIGSDGLLAETETFRKLLNMDELEKTAAGQREAERVWRRAFDRNGPLACCTPVLLDGFLYIRLKDGLACYDFRK